MTVCHLDMDTRQHLQRFEHHTEFAVGLDINLFIKDQIASTGWDRKAFIWSLHR